MGVPSRSRDEDSTGVNVVNSTPPGTYPSIARYPDLKVAEPATHRTSLRSMIATFGTISWRMRLNLFSRDHTSDASPTTEPADVQPAPAERPPSDMKFPADEVVWGIAIRNGYDEIDDPFYHRGTTQHAYLEGNDSVAICGFRPPQSGPRTRRRSRLGLPTTGEHPMCGMCARMVVAPRPRAPIPVQSGRPPVAVPIRPGRPPVAVPVATAGGRAPVPATPPAGVGPIPSPASVNGAAPAPTQATVSPWVKQRSGSDG